MAGHAFLDTFTQAPTEARECYLSPNGGTKITLAAKSAPVLCALYAAAQDRGLPCALIDEDGAVAVGIGPATRDQCRPLTKRFQLMK